MSRSYKKTPIIKDNGKSKKIAKTFAVRKTRRKLKDLDYEIADGKSYKKEFESWAIADHVLYWTEEQARAHYESKCNEKWFIERWPTIESFLKYWYKCMKRK